MAGLSHFDAVATRLLDEHEDVTSGRMLQAIGLKTRGKVFAMDHDGRLVVKLPEDRVNALIAGGVGRPFGRKTSAPAREWVSLAVTSDDETLAYALEARSFVGG